MEENLSCLIKGHLPVDTSQDVAPCRACMKLVQCKSDDPTHKESECNWQLYER